MLLLLMTCSVFLQLSTATLIQSIKYKEFRLADLEYDPQKFHKLLNLIEDAKNDEKTVLEIAIRFAAIDTYTGKNSKLICELLLNSGVDVNAKNDRGWTPLMYAAISNNLDVVNLFLQKGAYPNKKNGEGKTALDIISKPSIFHDYEPVRAKIKEFRGPDLLNAISTGQFKNANLQKDSPELQELLNLIEDAVKNSEIDAIGCHGCTALFLTVQPHDYFTGENSKLIFELLQDNGADVNKRSESSGFLPLFTAASKNEPELVEFLLRKGANPCLTYPGVGEDRTVLEIASNLYNTFDRCAPILKLYMENKGWAILNLNLNTFFIQKNINYGPIRTMINEFLGYHLQPKKYNRVQSQTLLKQKLVEDSDTELCNHKTNESDNNLLLKK